ncbi:MAG: anti-sigma factor antagonist [Eubacterium sp.]|nr:anti-sigma factor antagonist [Eubacterium sp.]
MNASVETNGALMIVYISGEIDHHSAKALREKIDSEITLKQPGHLILDYQHVTFMDSSGIGLVLGRYRLMQNYHGSVEVRNVSGQTKKIMELAGIGSVAIIREVKQ